MQQPDWPCFLQALLCPRVLGLVSDRPVIPQLLLSDLCSSSSSHGCVRPNSHNTFLRPQYSLWFCFHRLTLTNTSGMGWTLTQEASCLCASRPHPVLLLRGSSPSLVTSSHSSLHISSMCSWEDLVLFLLTLPLHYWLSCLKLLFSLTSA